MSPAEKEALTKVALGEPISFQQYALVEELCSAASVLSMRANLDSMEVTLGNATSLAEFQAARIVDLEELLASYKKICHHQHQDGFGRCIYCVRADELLSPPSEVKEKI